MQETTTMRNVIFTLCYFYYTPEETAEQQNMTYYVLKIPLMEVFLYPVF